MNFETSKNLGGVGAILLFISVLPYANFAGVLGLVGLILVLVALKGFADYYREDGIFTNAIYAVGVAIAGIVAVAVTLVLSLAGILRFIQVLIPSWNGDLTTLPQAISQVNPVTISSNITLNDVVPLLSAFLLILVIAFIFAILTAVLFRKSLRLLSARTGVGLFATAGLLLLVGAFLTIIAIGFLLIWIAFILLAVAFFSVRTATPLAAASGPQPPAY